MTAYNREPFIAEAIRSVLDNSYGNFELVIVDDCSADATVKIARTFAAVDTRISIYVNASNLGDYGNRNNAAGYAKGQYILYVDSDDMLLKDSLHKLVHLMENKPEVDMIMVCEDDSFCNKVYAPKELMPIHFFKKQLLIIGPGGTFLRRSFFDGIGRYSAVYGPANDSYFNLKAAAAGTLYLYDNQISFYRIHAGQEINNKYSYLHNNYSYLRDALAQLDLGLSPKQKDWLIKKNKRRFTVNLFKYFKRTRNVKATADAYYKANFSLKDAFNGIFH